MVVLPDHAKVRLEAGRLARHARGQLHLALRVADVGRLRGAVHDQPRELRRARQARQNGSTIITATSAQTTQVIGLA